MSYSSFGNHVTGTPLLSFVIPVWNVPEAMLKRSIASILALPLHEGEYEVIVVDDGSDKPVVLPDVPQAVSLRLVRIAHSGLARARNVGLTCARGVYMQMLDGDDYLLPAYIKIVDMVRAREASVIGFDYTRVRPETVLPDVAPRLPLNRQVFAVTSGADYMRTHNLRDGACGYAFMRCLATDLDYPEGVTHEDVVFTARLFLKAPSVLVLPIAPYAYTVRTASITQSADKAVLQRRLNDQLTAIRSLHQDMSVRSGGERVALQRKVAQLGMDIIYNTAVFTHSLAQVERMVKTMYADGLMPLPLQFYTGLYFLFALLSRCRAGRALLSLAAVIHYNRLVRSCAYSF